MSLLSTITTNWIEVVEYTMNPFQLVIALVVLVYEFHLCYSSSSMASSVINDGFWALICLLIKF